ncbi:family 16 glycoside hydrolase [Novipirellula caenicola]|uniref:BNR/Asp-box repeat protein n=1 Tax=Novipirellula caenicola TaxID=1536901 RepID=A0ABP9VYU1_9BACT
MLSFRSVLVPFVITAILLVTNSVPAADTLVSGRDVSNASIIPDDWDPALAGDQVMQRLVRVTGPEVKGAHDSEFVVVGDQAYVVAELSDQRAGESPAWPEVYCAMSIVDLKTLDVKAIVPLARTEQVFANVALPIGACFVPRIRQISDATLRCYFASEQPGVRQSQIWYRDFDLRSQQFLDTIHKAKLKTAAGTFDMQPRYLHADAVAHGVKKQAKDYGMYLFDSFKVFDGKTYVALNNFPGKQNALAIAHDDFATFEVVGHFNEPQSASLSESAANQLPDGTWMAICRNDGGNYHVTTSVDGKSWTPGRELSSIPNGANSKPTFDKFGDTYYLGWQEATRIQGVSRSVFNIDISQDGKSWQRKYRFETTKSFQYPAFHEHNGAIWLSVTQGDSSPSRKERVMFGKLESVGEFESQTGKNRTPIAASAEQAAVLKPGVKLFTNRDYTLTEAPDFLMGRKFVRTSIEGHEIECVKPGEVFVMTLSKSHPANQSVSLLKQGFTKADTPEFQLFPGEINRVFAYRKSLNPGDRLRFDKLAFLVLGEATEITSRVTKGRAAPQETPEQAAERIEKMEKIAEHALETPVLNTSPLPEYDYDKLDYGMTIGIERTPGGRLWACWVAGGDSPEAFFVLATSDDDGETWSPPRLVVDTHNNDLPRPRSVLVGNLWTDPLGRLWLFFDQSMDMFDGRAGVWATRCDNPDADDPVWTTPRRIADGVMLNKPTVLSSGEWMLPISLDQRPGFGPFRGCFSELDPLRGASVHVSIDQGATWQRRGAATFPNPDWHEHMIIERTDGTLWMLARTARGMMQTTSNDRGRTWQTPTEHEVIRHPNARFFVRRLASGRILLIKHGDKIDSHQGRVQLSAWLSDDEGKTWSGGLVLDDRKGISYPDGLQSPDGTIYISYDRNRATDGEILMARFSEEDVLAKKLVSERGKLRMLISKPMAKKIAKMSEAESRQGFVELFDGKTFDGWQQDGNWRIEDGAFFRAAKGGSLTYKRKKVPDDFELRFEWKVSKGCNSGVYYRPGQVEYQVLDNIGSPYGENPRQAAASLFFCMAPSKDATRPVGQWNTARVVCKGSVIQHWLNGEKVLDFDYTDPKWADMVKLLTIRGGDLTGRGGELWLQDHGQPVWFRNLRWREIPPAEELKASAEFKPMPVPAGALAKEQERVQKMLEQAKSK